MSDPTDPVEGTQADVSAETAQGAVETESTPPWGEDFDPQRAWDSIQAGRKTEKELKERLRAEQTVWEDEQRLRAKLTELGYQFEDDTEDDDEDLTEYGDDEAPDPRVEAHDAWIRQQQERQALKEFNDDLDAAAKEQQVKLTNRERQSIFRESVANGFTPEATREALTGLIEDRKALRDVWQNELKESKKAPSAPSSGQTVTEVPDLDDDETRREWMGERLRALNES